MTNADCCAIAVMAKAPRRGHVKTRLCPPLSPEEAQALAAAFLRDTTENIVAAARVARIVPFVAYAPAGFEATFDGRLADGTRLLLADGLTAMPAPLPEGVERFGLSLFHALHGLLAQGFGAACVLNADGPTLPTARLIEAARVLLDGGGPGRAVLGRAVLGPAEDGGYYLLGIPAGGDPAALLRGIAWSTDRVADQTRACAATATIALHELAPWYDVDEATALTRLAAELRAGVATETADDDRHRRPFAARATAAAFAALDLTSRF